MRNAKRALLLALLFGCGAPAATPPGTAPTVTSGPTVTKNLPPDTTIVDAEVARVLDDWHDAAAKADEERYFAHFAEGGVFMGTDAKERWTVPEFKAYAHPHFAKGKAWSFHATRREVTFRQGVAWFDEDLDTPNLGLARGSGVLVRDDRGTWKIAHYNLSVPIPNERFKEVKAIIEGASQPAITTPPSSTATAAPVPKPSATPPPTKPKPPPAKKPPMSSPADSF
jgi:hypothetical protein